MRVAVGELGRRLRRETRLSRAARPGQSEQADVLAREQPEHLAQLALAAQEGRRRDRQIRLVETLEWREVVVSELVDALGRRHVFQAVLAEVAQLVCAEEGSARGGDQDLAAVATGGDPGGPVHVDSDVALVPDVRRPRMDAHAHAEPPRSESFERLCRRRKGIRCRREGDEESIPLRVHLDPPVRADRLANDAAMFGERFFVLARAQLVQQLCRALYVGKEEGDGSGGKGGPHGVIMRQGEGPRTGPQAGASLKPPASSRAAIRFSSGGCVEKSPLKLARAPWAWRSGLSMYM